MPRELRNQRKRDRRNSRLKRKKKSEKVISGFLLAQSLVGPSIGGAVVALVTNMTAAQSASAVDATWGSNVEYLKGDLATFADTVSPYTYRIYIAQQYMNGSNYVSPDGITNFTGTPSAC